MDPPIWGDVRRPECEIDRLGGERVDGGIEVFCPEDGGGDTCSGLVGAVDVRHCFGGFTAFVVERLINGGRRRRGERGGSKTDLRKT